MMNTQQRHASPLAPEPLSELPPRTFETERLTLRAMEVDDAELVYTTYASDPVVTKYLSVPCASHPDDSRPFVGGIADNFAGREGIHKQYGWLVSRKDTGQCIGCVGFGIKDASSLSGGYVFAQSAWGRASRQRHGGRLLHGQQASLTSNASRRIIIRIIRRRVT
jgi:RimJ/RimL family protein N-acetyltransferase